MKLKAIPFLIFVLFTFYLAGMYRYTALLVLAAAEAIILAVSFVIPSYFKKRLKITFSKHADTAFVNNPCEVSLALNYKGKIPITKYRVKTLSSYDGSEKKSKCCLYGECEGGESSASFSFLSPYCGMAQISVKSVVTYDYLSLFSSRHRSHEKMDIAVYPRDIPMKLEILSINTNTEVSFSDEYSFSGQDGDVRDIREYRDGDSVRRNQCQLSAKTDATYIKEYERESDKNTDVFVDSASLSDLSLPDKSDYYFLFFSLLCGILSHGGTATVYYHDADSISIITHDIKSKSDAYDLLLKLYRIKYANRPHQANSPDKAFDTADAVYITPSLEMYRGDTLIHKFSRESMEYELNDMTFTF